MTTEVKYCTYQKQLIEWNHNQRYQKIMETNTSIQDNSGMEKPHCETGNVLYLLWKYEKLYLPFTTILQVVLTVIINNLVLMVIKHTKQQKNRFLRTTRLLSIHDISAALVGRSAILVFLN